MQKLTPPPPLRPWDPKYPAGLIELRVVYGFESWKSNFAFGLYRTKSNKAVVPSKYIPFCELTFNGETVDVIYTGGNFVFFQWSRTFVFDVFNIFLVEYLNRKRKRCYSQTRDISILNTEEKNTFPLLSPWFNGILRPPIGSLFEGTYDILLRKFLFTYDQTLSIRK